MDDHGDDGGDHDGDDSPHDLLDTTHTIALQCANDAWSHEGQGEQKTATVLEARRPFNESLAHGVARVSTVAIQVPIDLAPAVNLHIELHGEAKRTASSCKCLVETTYQKGVLQGIQDERRRYGQTPRN